MNHIDKASTTYIGYAELMTMPMMMPNTKPASAYLAKSAIDPSRILYFFMIVLPSLLSDIFEAVTRIAVESASATAFMTKTADRIC